MAIQIGVDVGGTFTDISAAVNGRLLRAKAYSTRDVTTGICDVIAKLCALAGLDERTLLGQVDKFVLGNTVVTNAIDEEKLGRVALLTTAGFRDTLRIGRSARGPARDPHLIRQRRELVRRSDIFEIHERVDKNGVLLVAADPDEIREAIRQAMARGITAVAVSFLWSFRNGASENLVARILDEEFPDLPYTLSSRLAPVFREYERTVTTVLDAAVKPIVANHFATLGRTLRERGLETALKIMQVDGGFVSIAEALKAPIKMFNSGPVGGVEGARRLGASLGVQKIITGDMGGTSFDAAVIIDGECRVLSRADIGEYPTALTAVDITSIGAGGGSLAWIDSRGMLRVGPASVGSTPGPACYGRGGKRPSVTDASVALGLIDPDYFLGGAVKLDKTAAMEAIDREIARPLGMTVEEAAAGIHRLAIHQMANAVRTLTVNRGHDPREFTLVSFGGGGGLFTGHIANICSVSRVLSPATASVFSAYGLLNADSMLTLVRTSAGVLEGRVEEIEREYQELEAHIDAWFEQDGIPLDRREVIREADMKFSGQIFDATTKLSKPLGEDDVAEIRLRFTHDYEAEFGEGTAWTEAPIQVTNLRLRGIGRFALVDAAIAGGASLSHTEKAERHIYDPMLGQSIIVPVLRGFASHDRFAGPLIIEEPDTTIYVPTGMVASRDEHGNYMMSSARSPSNIPNAPCLETEEA